MGKRGMCLMACAAMTLAAALAFAETAREIPCRFVGADRQAIHCLDDGDYKTRWSARGNSARLTLEPETGEAIGGVYVKFYNTSCAFDVQVKDDAGKWQTVAACDGTYLAEYVPLGEPADAVRIRPQGSERLALAEVQAFTGGEAPDFVQRWQPPHEKADLLLISAHPDDEVIFMGGTIPHYAGQLKKAVQVAYLVPATPYRKLELLDGLWLCGCRNYPDIGAFPDRFATSISGMYKQEGWSEDALTRHVVSLYRRYRPDVALTHDVNGEYGHGAHRVAADVSRKAIALAADAAYQNRRLHEKEPWQVQKLYLHLYEEGALRMDWRVPLSAFGGKTAFDMAEAAFQCHVSQLDTEYRVEDFGPYDNAKFGLAYTAVGADENKNDFFEHIEKGAH